MKDKELYLLLFEEKKRKFVRINFLVEICLFMCVFFETYIFSYTFDLCGRVGDKKISHPADFRKQDYFFLDLRKSSKKVLDVPEELSRIEYYLPKTLFKRDLIPVNCFLVNCILFDGMFKSSTNLSGQHRVCSFGLTWSLR